MPKVRANETRDNYLSRCIPMLIDEGKSQDQAVAICQSMYDTASKEDDGNTLTSEPVSTRYIRPETALPGRYPEIDISSPLPKQLQPGGRFLVEEEELLRQP